MEAQGQYRFEDFTLDVGERQLRREGQPLEVSARYFDALALLVSERGKLVSKDRFLDEVWAGVPVTDEALSQCIKTLRKLLGDDAARPRFIQTVPKHGYRFVAPVTEAGAPLTAIRGDWGLGRLAVLTGAGTLGGGVAGMAGGILYGMGGAFQPVEAGIGAASVLIVMLGLTIIPGLLGGFGVSLGMAIAHLRAGNSAWIVLGGALGGLLIGTVTKLFGVDTFNLLFGRSPGGITGGFEGAVLGGVIALGAWLAGAFGPGSFRRSVIVSGVAGAIAGALIPLMGGRMMGGSLELVAHRFEGSRLRLDPIGQLFGEEHFGPVSQSLFGAVEGFLFGSCLVGALVIAVRAGRAGGTRNPSPRWGGAG